MNSRNFILIFKTFLLNFSSNFTQRKNVQIDEAAMTDTLRGNNLLSPNRASNPKIPRIRREASTEKIHSNYGINI